jgi:8-oxo-dGTP diphosphatase
VHRRVSVPSPALPVVCALIERDDRVLLARRPASKHLGGLWEFPGGKIEPAESPAAALAREIGEELDCVLVVTHDLGVFNHRYETVTIALHAFVARLAGGSAEPHPREHDEIAWVRPEELDQYPLAPADVPVVTAYHRHRPTHPA